MYVVAPAARVRRGVRRLVLALCALILGAGFTPALPPATVTSTPVTVAEPAAPAVSIVDSVGEPLVIVAEPVSPGAPMGTGSGTEQAAVLRGVAIGAVAGRAPPSISA